ncbi:MAG: class I SAM-dependent RNA methyltransferase [Candidatus Muiribacteriota bacterium]
MSKIKLTATCAFGIESILKRELKELGFEQTAGMDGRIDFEGSLSDIAKTNINLRTAERVYVNMGEFDAISFDDLFENTKKIPWEKWIAPDGKFSVNGKSVKSQLSSVPACQSIVKKAIVERLKEAYGIKWFKETGAEFPVDFSLLKDKATLFLDTSGTGLHKRGYRTETVEAPMRETLAAALVLLSYWNKDRLLVDPMCGSGTICIEAALIGKNIAPGLNRDFCSEKWPVIDQKLWKNQKEEALKKIDNNIKLQIKGSDHNPACIEAAKHNASKAGVLQDITFEVMELDKLWIDKQYGVVITNPPYGIRLTDFTEINKLYISFNKIFKKKTGWSIYIITADALFENYFKRSKPDRKRKLYTGKIKVNLYQYFGERPAD